MWCRTVLKEKIMLQRFYLWLSFLALSSCVGVKSQSIPISNNDYIKANIIQRMIVAVTTHSDSLPLARIEDLPMLTQRLAELNNLPGESTKFSLRLVEYQNPHNTVLSGKFFQLTIDQPIVSRVDTSTNLIFNPFGCVNEQWPVTILAHYQMGNSGEQILKTLSGPVYLNAVEFPLVNSPYEESSLSMALFYRFFRYGINRPVIARFTNRDVNWKSSIKDVFSVKQANVLGVFTASKTEDPRYNNILLYVTEDKGYIRGHITYFVKDYTSSGIIRLVKYSATSIINTSQGNIECLSSVVLSEQESLKILNGPFKHFIY